MSISQSEESSYFFYASTMLSRQAYRSLKLSFLFQFIRQILQHPMQFFLSFEFYLTFKLTIIFSQFAHNNQYTYDKIFNYQIRIVNINCSVCLVKNIEMNNIQKIPLPPNSPQITKQDIQNGKVIYQGDYCDVYQVNKSGKQYAIKIIYNNRINLDRFGQQMQRVCLQIQTLYSIKHNNIIQLLGHFQRDGTTGLIFPLFGRPLMDFVKERKKKSNPKKLYTVNDFIKIFRGVGGAIFQLYSMGFVHRDITDDNVLIDENYNTKLIDFGFIAKIQKCKGRFGSRQYFAPEIISGKSYNHKVDVWSFGILCYQLLYGILLFKPKAKNLSQEQLDKQYLKNMSLPIEDLPDEKLILDEKPNQQIIFNIKTMLNLNSYKRPEIGYLLSKKTFGADQKQPESYNINQYVRQKTQRKTNKAQGIMHSNVKQMSVSQLQQTLIMLINSNFSEMNKRQQLYTNLIKQQSKLVKAQINLYKNV